MSATLRLRSLSFGTLAIPFTTRFRHASAERSETSSVWITAMTTDGVTGHGESCPRPYVTGESLESAERFFRAHESTIRAEVTDLGRLRHWVDEHASEIDEYPAAWCAIELAVLDALSKSRAETIEAALAQPPLAGEFRYSAVLGDADEAAFAKQVERYVGAGFRDFKVKLSGDLARDRAKLAVLAPGPRLRVRVDANNLWRAADEAIAFLAGLEYPLFAVEEPLAPRAFDALARVADAIGAPVVLDESATRLADLEALASRSGRWIVNVRVSKMGGLLRSLDIVAAARAAGLRVIVGAQVGETSLLTRAGLTAAQAAGPALVAQEGAFGTHLLARDICDPPLMFDAGGRLAVSEHARLTDPGLGVTSAAGVAWTDCPRH